MYISVYIPDYIHTRLAVRRPADMLLWVALVEVPLTSLVDSCTTLLTWSLWQGIKDTSSIQNDFKTIP